MWDEESKTLYIQVGIGAGDAKGTFVGDHDVWRLPEADDDDRAQAAPVHPPPPGLPRRRPRQAVSPNLAGRVAAAFALAAQLDAVERPARARADSRPPP